MDPRPRRPQLSGLAWLVGLVVGAAVLTVASLLVLTAARDEASARLFLDTYELTGSRLAGLVSLKTRTKSSSAGHGAPWVTLLEQ